MFTHPDPCWHLTAIPYSSDCANLHLGRVLETQITRTPLDAIVAESAHQFCSPDTCFTKSRVLCNSSAMPHDRQIWFLSLMLEAHTGAMVDELIRQKIPFTRGHAHTDSQTLQSRKGKTFSKSGRWSTSGKPFLNTNYKSTEWRYSLPVPWFLNQVP